VIWHHGNLLAHGVGGRGDLPLPFALALFGAAIALVVSFAMLAWRWPEPRLRGSTAGRPVPAWLADLLRSPEWLGLWQVVGVVALAYTAYAAFLGPDISLNPTAGIVYVLFWVGTLAVLSVVLGPVWRRMNPLRTVQQRGWQLLHRDPHEGLLGRYPARLGYWPAALFLLSFVWLELVGPERASTVTLRWWFVAYATLQLVGSALWGSSWFTHADGFEVMSSLFGRLSMLGRRDDDVIVLRHPLAGLDQIALEPGLVATVSVMLGSTAYDGFSENLAWVNLQQESSLPKILTGSVGLLAVIGFVAGTFVLASWLCGVLGDDRLPHLARQFAPSLVPIAFGYVLAHYWSLLVLEGQRTIVKMSDPLADGSNWFGMGTAGFVNDSLIRPSVLAPLQVLFVVTGHVLGIVLAHDRAVALFPHRHAVRGQLPMLVVMVVYTLGGLLLLFST
jgi:hypothetical protein